MSNTRMPLIGEVVLFTPNPNDEVARSNHNRNEIAAIVTRVWSESCVNIKIVPDCGPMQDRTSVVHHSINPAGYHFRFQNEEKEVEDPASNVSNEETADASSFLTKKQEV